MSSLVMGKKQYFNSAFMQIQTMFSILKTLIFWKNVLIKYMDYENHIYIEKTRA